MKHLLYMSTSQLDRGIVELDMIEVLHSLLKPSGYTYVRVHPLSQLFWGKAIYSSNRKTSNQFRSTGFIFQACKKAIRQLDDSLTI